MKTKVAVFLMTLLAGLCLMMSAWAAPGDAVLFPQPEGGMVENSAESIAAVGDTLYMLTQKGLYAWKASDAEPKLVSDKVSRQYAYYASLEDIPQEEKEKYENSVNLLFQSNGKLYGLNTSTGSLLLLDVTAEGVNVSKAYTLDWEGMFIKEADYSYPRQIFSSVLTKDRLYLLAQQPTQYWNDYDLLSFDLATGKQTKIPVENVHAIATYEGGKLLCNIFDWENSYTPDGKPVYPSLSVLDPATQALTKLVDFPASQVGGLSYDDQSGMIYVLGRGELYGSKQGAAFETVAYMPVDYPGDQMAATIVSGGLYAAIPNYGTVYVRNIDPAYKSDRVLRILGGYSDEVTRAFQAAHPEIPVVFEQQTSLAAEQITQRMVSGTDNVDLLMISLSYGGFSSLRDKGYVSDLSQSAILTDTAAKMYPKFVESLYKDGKLIAFPCQFYSTAMGYSPDVMKLLEIEQPPKTLAELMDLYVDWVEEYGPENGNYQLQENVYDIRQELLSTILMNYLAHYAKTGEELAFDTPVFRALIDKLDKVTPILKELNPDPDEQQGGMVAYSSESGSIPTALFTSNLMLNPENYSDNRGYVPLLLSLDEGVEPACFAQVSVFVINPNSKNQDLAMTYLEFLAQNMPRNLSITLCPDDNAPVEDPSYAAELDNANKQLDDFREQLKTMAPEDVKMMEDNIKNYEEYIANIEDRRFMITEEKIAQYRSLVPYIYVDTENLDFLTGSPESLSLLQQFLQGKTDSQQFIKEFDRKLQMMRMENK